MKRPFKVVSFFDGISCIQIALHAVGIKNYIIYASEINKKAIKVTQYHWPNTIQVGDIVDLDPAEFRDVDLVVGGSPCQTMSRMGRGQGITTVNGTIIRSLAHYEDLKNEWRRMEIPYDMYFNQSALYWEFIRMLRGIQVYNPNVLFLLENVRSKLWESLITLSIGVLPRMINSSRVTAQNRERNYWSNLPLTYVEDRNILLGDVIPGALTGAAKRGRKPRKGDIVDVPLTKKGYMFPLTLRTDFKSNCILCSQKPTGYYMDTKGNVCDFTPEDAEVLQSLPKGYTDVDGLSKSERFKLIGNAWTPEVITYFLRNIDSRILKYRNHPKFVKV